MTEPAFEVGQVGRVAEREHVRLRRRLQCVLVGGDEAERVAEPGRALDVGGAAVQRDGDEQVEVELAAVVGDELAADAVDLAGAELGHELDLLLAEQVGQVLGGDRLGEAAVERRREHELAACADSALAQVPVGEEGELDRRDRALDRHVGDVHDQPAAVEALERALQRRGARQVVEGEDALVPAGAGHALGLLRLKPHAAGDDEHVVGEHGAVVEQHLVALDPDLVDLVLVEDDAVA